MHNGSGSRTNIFDELAAHDRLRDTDARLAVHNFPIPIGARTMRYFTERYDYWECREQVEQWVLGQTKLQCRDTWDNEHPFLKETKLPSNDLRAGGQQASRRRIRATARLAKQMQRRYSRQRSGNTAVAEHANFDEIALSRLRRWRIGD